MKIHRNSSLKKLNTFNVDEVARLIFVVDSISDLPNILSNKKDEILVLGGGSNILFTKPYNGLIINLKNKGKKIIQEDENTVLVEVSAGENWHEFVLWAIKNNFGGLENLSLIPGNLGAAPIQNIRAYGVELKDIFYSCKGLMLDTLSEFEFKKTECKFDYRTSIFKSTLKNKTVITSVKLILTKSKHNYNIDYKDLNINLKNTELSVKKISDEVIKIRTSKLPNPKFFGNCGSFFKNPIANSDTYKSLLDKFPNIPVHKIDEDNYKISAAWLIDQSGFKNKKDKNVGVYKNQPLVIINYGKATGKELLNFALNIKEVIYNNFEIELEEEVIIM